MQLRAHPRKDGWQDEREEGQEAKEDEGEEMMDSHPEMEKYELCMKVLDFPEIRARVMIAKDDIPNFRKFLNLLPAFPPLGMSANFELDWRSEDTDTPIEVKRG